MTLFRVMRNPWVSFFGPLVPSVALFTAFLMLGGDSFRHAFSCSLALMVVFSLLSEWRALRRRQRAPVRT